ncbi:MAG: tripartite tricarboxylate transporter substrate binding protein [Pseudomonadota bacterium]
MPKMSYRGRQHPTQLFRRCLLIGLLGLGLHATAADGIPGTGPIRLVVPYVAGGPADLLARKIAQKLGERLHRAIVIDNKSGAGGSVGAAYVVRAEPDGTTILYNTSTMAIDPVLRRNLPYDVLRDLTPVTTAVVGPLAILVNPKVPAKNIAEFVAYAKAHPGKLNFGSAGAGSSLHMATEQFALAAGIKLVHVPYKGGSETLMATIADDIQFAMNPMPSALQYARNGKELRALAVTTRKHSAIWPELPTVAESGVQGLEAYDSSIWYQFYLPSKTPQATVEALNADIRAVLKQPDLDRWLQEQGMEALGDTPEQAGQRLRSEIQRWTEVAKATGIKIE